MTTILGIRVDDLSLDAFKETVRVWLKTSEQHKIFTPNAEMILAARSNSNLKACLNSDDLNLADSISVVWASKLNKNSVRQRIPGVDALEMICQIAAEEGKRVLFFGAGAGVSVRASEMLSQKYPKLLANGIDPGLVNLSVPQARIIEEIAKYAPDVLAVALGHGKQEQFICSVLSQLPSVKIAIGVGGALDYLSGAVSRAPHWMRRLGIEWLYRLMRQPWRIGRIFNAVVVFPIAVIWDKIKSKL